MESERSAPVTRFLQYTAEDAGEPTRVRAVTARWVGRAAVPAWINGVLWTGAALVMVALDWHAGTLPAVDEVAGRYGGWWFLAGASVNGAVILWAAPGAVASGRRGWCVAATLAVMVEALFLMGITGALGAFGASAVADPGYASRWRLLAFVPMVLGVWGIGAASDLFTCLQWIAARPHEDSRPPSLRPQGRKRVAG